jgi:MFS transporter, DHA2 family, multidrug resistance protein
MAPDAADQRPLVNPWIIAISVMTATFMEVLDTTVVNVSLPHIAGNLSATIDEATLVLTSYLVANAIILPMTGWISNFFGRRRFLLVAVSGFTVASFCCGLAPNLEALVFFRVIQGLTGGAMQPISQAVMLESFPLEERGKAMGFWGLGIIVAPILGPVFGGWLTDTYSWRWVFYINGPVGVVSFLMIRQFVFDPPYIKRAAGGIDYWGIGMLAVGIGALQYLLDKGQQEDWFASTLIVGLAVLAVVTLVVFVIRELSVTNPIVDLRVFKVREYTAGVFLMMVLGFVLYGSLVLLPIMLQTLFGYPAMQAGFATAPRGLGALIFMPLVGLFVARVDPRKLIGTGLLIGGVSLLWLGDLSTNAGYWDIFWPQFIQGTSLGLIFVPLTTITMDAIPVNKMGNATSLFSLTRNVGASIGIAMTSTWLIRQQQVQTSVLGSNVDPYNEASRATLDTAQAAFIASGSDPTTAMQLAYGAVSGMVGRQATMLSFVEIFRTLGWIFILMLPLLLLTRRPRHQRQ